MPILVPAGPRRDLTVGTRGGPGHLIETGEGRERGGGLEVLISRGQQRDKIRYEISKSTVFLLFYWISEGFLKISVDFSVGFSRFINDYKLIFIFIAIKN